jgi:hypothetical protein
LLFPLLALAATSSGCAYEHAEYQEGPPRLGYADPSESTSPPVLRYGIPADAPKGQVYVMSLGVETLTAMGGQPESLLHLRVAVENNASDAWVLDSADTAVRFDDGPPVRPTYAKGYQPGGRQTIAAGGRGDLDLYFAMPTTVRPQHANLRWEVHPGADTVTANSSFDLMTGQRADQVYYEPVYDPALVYAWGPGWWWGSDWYWGFGGWWGAPWWWGGWGWGPGFRHPWGPFHGGWGVGWRGGLQHGGGFQRGGSFQRGGGGFHGGGFHGGGFHGGGGHR